MHIDKNEKGWEHPVLVEIGIHQAFWNTVSEGVNVA